MTKNDGNNAKQNGKNGTRRLLLNKQTVRNLLTADQLKAVHGGMGNDGDGNSSRNGGGGSNSNSNGNGSH